MDNQIFYIYDMQWSVLKLSGLILDFACNIKLSKHIIDLSKLISIFPYGSKIIFIRKIFFVHISVSNIKNIKIYFQ